MSYLCRHVQRTSRTVFVPFFQAVRHQSGDKPQKPSEPVRTDKPKESGDKPQKPSEPVRADKPKESGDKPKGSGDKPKESAEKPKEPSEPKITSEKIPGPKSTKLKQDLNQLQQAESVANFVDYEKSFGNYMADADGNMILDCFTQVSSLPVGYNHPRIIKLLQNEKNIRTMINRPSLGLFPSKDWPEKLKSVLMSVAPKGLPNVMTANCYSCANENAFKCAFMAYVARTRGDDEPYTQEEISSCMANQPPGSPKMCILSFKGSFHGRTMGSLSASSSRYIQKIGVPAFEWPIVPYPIYQYPLDDYITENKDMDKRVLANVENMIDQNKKYRPVAGVIIEPILSEGCDREASPQFFRALRALCKKKKVAFIVDEKDTGCGTTGKMWGHEHYELEEPPDIVTFSKKMMVSGFYHTNAMRPRQPYRVFSAYMGDPGKLLILEEVLKIIKDEDLLENATFAGDFFLAGLMAMEREYPELMHSVRGRGCMIAFCAVDQKTRNAILQRLIKKGVQASIAGDISVRFRTALIFKQKQVEIVLDRLKKVMGEIDQAKGKL